MATHCLYTEIICPKSKRIEMNNYPSMSKLVCMMLFLPSIFPLATLAQDPGKALKSPTAKRADIQVEHVMEVKPKAVRLVRNQVTGSLWYTTFDGDVYEI